MSQDRPDSNYSDREKAVISIFDRWDGCTKCELGRMREERFQETHGKKGHIVFGDGNASADLIIIGIGPGEQEDEEGCPFVGKSGEILNQYLDDVGMPRKDVFVMNIVACRPFTKSVDFKTKRKLEENRDPTLQEREACRPMWHELLYTIDPLLVVAMGKPTVMELTGTRSITMQEVQGVVTTFQIPGRVVPVTYTLIPMYHPAFLSRTGNTFQGGPWHQALVSWKRAIYLLDQLRNLYYGTPIPDRGFQEKDLFIIQGA